MSNIDLTQYLKNKEGDKIYCLLTGEYVTFIGFDNNSKYPIVVRDSLGNIWRYPKEGYKYSDYPNGECMLVPSKDQRDWSKFLKPIQVDTPMMCSDDGTNWHLRFYKGFVEKEHRVFPRGQKQWESKTDDVYYRFIVPYDKFNPSDMEEFLKYNIQK